MVVVGAVYWLGFVIIIVSVVLAGGGGGGGGRGGERGRGGGKEEGGAPSSLHFGIYSCVHFSFMTPIPMVRLGPVPNPEKPDQSGG